MRLLSKYHRLSCTTWSGDYVNTAVTMLTSEHANTSTAIYFNVTTEEGVIGQESYCPWLTVPGPGGSLAASSHYPWRCPAAGHWKLTRCYPFLKLCKRQRNVSGNPSCLPGGGWRGTGRSSWWDTGNGITWWPCDSSLSVGGTLRMTGDANDEAREARKSRGTNHLEGGGGFATSMHLSSLLQRSWCRK